MNNYNLPDDKGHFEQYGGVFIAETLMTAVLLIVSEITCKWPNGIDNCNEKI
jgi:tryptophan synthase beta subunit